MLASDPDAKRLGAYYGAYLDARVEPVGLEPLRQELARIAALESTADLPELFAGAVSGVAGEGRRPGP